MSESPLTPFSVRASRGDYYVRFTDDAVAALRPLQSDSAVLVIDADVARRYPALVRDWPADRVFPIEATEPNKSLEGCRALMERLIACRVRRNHLLVAVGGGIVQDVTAFSASVLYRGLSWAFVPTTLLAQADSCIGSKTSINLGEIKNVLGNFYPPSWVLIDTGFLQSLSDEDICSGIGEMLHYFVYADSPLLTRVIEEHAALRAERRKLLPYIHESLSIKRSVIEADEFDRGERNKFNYGHTFGHALESVSNYEIRHGQAVTVGMDIANFVSAELGVMRRDEFDALHELLRVNFPRYDWSRIDIDRYGAALSRDKKNTSDDVTCILAEGRGALFKRALPLREMLLPLVRAYFEHAASAAV